MKKNKVLIIGSHGVPPQYGGFETLVDNLIIGLTGQYHVGIVCSSNQKEKLVTYKGSKLFHINLSASGKTGLLYDFLSVFYAVIYRYNNVIYLGPSFGALMIITKLFGIKTLINFGGLDEWSRPKYSKITSLLIKFNYWLACKFSDIQVADNNIVAESIKNNFAVDPYVIRYGGDHVSSFNRCTLPKQIENLDYALVVARAQEDTQLKKLIDAWPKIGLRLVVISNWKVSEYGLKAKCKGETHPNVTVLDAIYNQDLLNSIRANCRIYIHTHTLCGTAPSLVEMIFLGVPIASFDLPTNRETLNNIGLFWKDTNQLNDQISKISENDLQLIEQKLVGLRRDYLWSNICDKYNDLLMKEL